jgi:hypothetical protein
LAGFRFFAIPERGRGSAFRSFDKAASKSFFWTRIACAISVRFAMRNHVPLGEADRYRFPPLSLSVSELLNPTDSDDFAKVFH